MRAALSPRWRLALAGLLAVAGAPAVALLAADENADGVRAGGGRWASLQPSPLARTEVGAARVGRTIYVVGGFLPPDGATGNQVARYDIETGTWALAAPMPIAVNHPALAVSGGRIFVYGGFTDSGALTGETDALQRYDPATDSWATLTGSGVRRGAATLAPVGRRLYAIGGVGGGAVQRLVQVYELRSGSWSGGPPMRVAREHLASGVIGDRIIVLGGRDAGRNLDAVEVLSTRTRKWKRLPRLRTARSGFQAAVVKGHLVAVGGEQLDEGDQTIAPVEIYDPAEKRWRALPAMLTPRHGLGVASRGRTVFAIEGGPQPGLTFSSALEALRVPRSLLNR
ncbi:MAG: Kelch repeat-containing protein [Solirubrobacterales bacterium]